MAHVLPQDIVVATFNGLVDWEAATIDADLVMTNTTADTETEAATIGDITTIDICDATGCTRQDVTSPSVSADDVDNEMVWTCDNLVFTGLSGDATRDIQGVIFRYYVDGSTGDLFMLFDDFTADVTSAATQITVPAPAEGFLNIGQPA